MLVLGLRWHCWVLGEIWLGGVIWGHIWVHPAKGLTVMGYAYGAKGLTVTGRPALLWVVWRLYGCRPGGEQVGDSEKGVFQSLIRLP